MSPGLREENYIFFKGSLLGWLYVLHVHGSRWLTVLSVQQMVLAFKLSPQPQPDSQAVQVTVHRDCTVEECLHLMVQAAGLSGEYCGNSVVCI